MAVTYGYFNSINGDRKYNADQMSDYFRGIVNEGVFQHLNGGLAVVAGTGMEVTVATGRAIVQNKWVQNDAAFPLTIEAASDTYGRKDAVVIRLSYTNRAISIVVKTGTPSASPAAPSLTRSSTTYEMALAYVNVSAGATSVTVTDKRSDTSVCGWATVAQETSGEVDAMLEALKTGFDGVTYASPAEMVRTCDTNLSEYISFSSGYLSDSGEFISNSQYLCSEFIPIELFKRIDLTAQADPVHIHVFDDSFTQTRKYFTTSAYSYPLEAITSNNERYFRIWSKSATPINLLSKIKFLYVSNQTQIEPYWINGFAASNGLYNYSLSYVISSKILVNTIGSITVAEDKHININYYDADMVGLSTATLDSGTHDVLPFVPAGAYYIRIWFSETDPNNYADTVVVSIGKEKVDETIELCKSIASCGPFDIKQFAVYEYPKSFRVDTEQIVTYSGYGMFTINNIGLYKILKITGYSESMSAIGYGIFDASGTILAKGGLSNNLTINIPDGASYIYLSAKDADKNNIGYIAESVINKKVDDLEDIIDGIVEGSTSIIIVGDSWSDTDPTHTTYTKWPEIFENNIPCEIHNYAQNGSSITGETPSYGLGGNVKGQVQAAIADGTYSHDKINLIILMGGINDFRIGRTSTEVSNAITSRINELKAEFTNARFVVFLNNQIYVTAALWQFIEEVKKGVKLNLGINAHSMIGWVPSANYISDLVHVDNTGYKYVAANVISCCFGGNATFVDNETEYTITDGDNNSYTLKIKELFSDDNYEAQMKLIVPSGVSGSESLSLGTLASDHKLICAIPLFTFMQNIGRTSAALLSNIKTSYAQNELTAIDDSNRGTKQVFTIQTGETPDTYIGRSANIY